MNSEGKTAVILAIEAGNIEVVKALFAKKEVETTYDELRRCFSRISSPGDGGAVDDRKLEAHRRIMFYIVDKLLVKKVPDRIKFCRDFLICILDTPLAQEIDLFLLSNIVSSDEFITGIQGVELLALLLEGEKTVLVKMFCQAATQKINEYCYSALTIAVKHGPENLVQTLLNHLPALMNRKNFPTTKIRECIDTAIKAGHFAMAKCIFETTGVHPSSSVAEQALIVQSENRNFDGVNALLAMNVDPNILNDSGLTPLELVEARSYFPTTGNSRRVIELLEMRGARNRDLNQTIILEKFKKWLKIQLEERSQDVDCDAIRRIITSLDKGHCAGFTWMKTLKEHLGQYHVYERDLVKIVNWNGHKSDLDEELNLLFKELCSIAIQAQNDKSLTVALDIDEGLLKEKIAEKQRLLDEKSEEKRLFREKGTEAFSIPRYNQLTENIQKRLDIDKRDIQERY